MNSENNPNANVSDTTSHSAPSKPAKADPPKVAEADFLTQQQEQARSALSGVLADMKQALANGADVREWTRQHPWILMGGATVAGLLAGMAVTPSKEQSFKSFFEQKWEELKGTATPPVPQTPEQTARVVMDQAQEPKPSVLALIIREALKAVGPTIGGLITGALASQQPSPEPGDGQAGHNPGNGNYGSAAQPEAAPRA